MGGLLWPWYVEVANKCVSLAGWSPPPPHSHFVNVFISRKEADRQKGKEDTGVGGEQELGGGER